MIESKIPILNIYYLLCYAWDKLEEGQKAVVSSADYKDSINLFGRVLVNGCHHLFKRGLDRNYVETTEEYLGIKGKIDFKRSLNKNLFRQGRSVCLFDDFTADILQNQILKATLYRLVKINDLDKDLKREVWDCYWRLQGVSTIELHISLFSRIRIHRNNSFYDFLLRVCRLIAENTVLDENTGAYLFREFIGSEKQMAALFEAFVRNFYKREQKVYSVRREDIYWDAVATEDSSYSYLPRMQTDITLESPNKKIIMETKYYMNALNTRYETEKLNSANLYQLYSYLRNLETKEGHAHNWNCEGILLYPSVNFTLQETFLLGNHLMKIHTIDLNADWKDLKQALLNIVVLD